MNHRTKSLRVMMIGIATLVVLFPGVVAAVKGPQDVQKTTHNFGGTSLYNAWKSNESEVCVFCHTPHGGTLTGPLWNRNNPTSTWSHYDSNTLGSHLAGLATNRAMGDESMICMSCHDGSVAVNHVINLPNSRGGAPITISGDPDVFIEDLVFFHGPRVGGGPANWDATGDLTDDHPISFSYDSVTNNSPYLPTESRNGELRTVGQAVTRGVRFFGATNRVECASCHDPHVDYVGTPYAPFLITPNTNSDLCFACHNK